MSGPSSPDGYPTDPNNQSGYPQYPQQPQPPYSQPPEYPPTQPPYPPQPYAQPPYSQPPAYQPPYSQPPYPPQPYAQPPAQPPKKGGGGKVFLILGIIAAVLILACVGGCVALGFGARIFATAAGTKVSQLATQAGTEIASTGALVTVTGFCQAESSQDYTTAYSDLSSSLQQQYSQSQFTQDGQQHDSTLGPITSCSPQGLPSLSGSTATITVMVTRTPASTPDDSGTAAPAQAANVTGQISLVQDSSGTWQVSSVDSSLAML